MQRKHIFHSVSRHIQALGLGVDVVSLGELAIARQAGFDPDCVHLHGNNKDAKEIAAAIEWGIHAIVADNLEEIDLIERQAAHVNRQVSVWLRVTPGIGVDTHPYVKTGQVASKFGLSVENGDAASGIQKATSSPHLILTGLHFHLGSQIFEADPYRNAISRLYDLAEATGYLPLEISPGGGWGVPYTPDDPVKSSGEWISSISQMMTNCWSKKGSRLPKLVVEPGRWMVAQAGIAIYSIGSVKRSIDGMSIIAVDGGMADNPRPMLYQSEYTACLAEYLDVEPEQMARVVGKFCESGDELIHSILLPDPHRGDHLVIPVSGAYQLSMISSYNLAARPTVLWLDDGQVEVLQRRMEAYEDPWWVGD